MDSYSLRLGDPILKKLGENVPLMILDNSKFRHLTYEVIQGKKWGSKVQIVTSFIFIQIFCQLGMQDLIVYIISGQL